MPKFEISGNERLVAAVDLGSNSFHMTIAKVTSSGLQILVRDKERVRLASGLNQKNILDKESIIRGLEALARFDTRLSGVSTDDIRVVATHTLREAQNADDFIDQAASVFRAPIEVISGPEEARLIFQAVANTQSINGRFLVFDIGGGSTEFAVGVNYETEFLSSRTLGCVTFTNQYMNKISKKAFIELELETKKAIEPIASRIRSLKIEQVFGSSGSAKGLSSLGNFLGFGAAITLDSIAACKRFVLKDMNRLIPDIPDVSPDRINILPAGIGIFSAIMEEFQIEKVHFADAALREGVLYGMDDRLKASDIRERTANDLAVKYGIDRDQAQRVRNTAEYLFDKAQSMWGLTSDDKQMLSWAAMLHEVGLQINYSGYHRHGSYIVLNTPMPGFNREQQEILGALVRMHRKKIHASAFPRLRYWSASRLMRLVRLLRIAYTMHVGRDLNARKFDANFENETIILTFQKRAKESSPVMFMDLQDEVKRQADEGLPLVIL